MSQSQTWTHRRARLAALRRYRSDSDPDVIDAYRALKAARAEDYLRDVIDSAPPLRGEDLERIRALLPPVPLPDGDAVAGNAGNAEGGSDAA